ncbi:MAG: lamin tail domain-containing protein [Saprospiraceae bacterium]|nr:lamin tail domain-containing protein [Saprospiraceae bacterium]
MKKLFATLTTIIILTITSHAQVVINEFMANSPGTGTDSLEFIELYNSGTSSVDISNWSFSQGVTLTFASGTSIPAGGYLVVVYDSIAFMNYFGISGVEFSGGLSNNGEDITLINNVGTTVDSVDYDGSGWSTVSNIDGWSMELCNISGDHNNAANWNPGSNATGVFFNGFEVLATPGAANTCSTPPVINYPVYTIDEINNLDANGVADSLNISCELRGIVHCVDFRGGTGIDFPFSNSSNTAGIRVFSYSDVNNYSVLAGDSLHISGTVSQFNGLLQFAPDSISVISQGNATASPNAVSIVDETTENKFIELNNVYIIDTSAWTNSGPGFNVFVTTGGPSPDTNMIRIDADIDLYGEPVPLGVFNITGWGGQYDSSTPYSSGYQLIPCSMDMLTNNTKIENSSYDLTIFPNPASTILNINSSFEINQIDIFNTLGQKITNQTSINSNTLQINTNNYGNGIYIINVISENKIMTKQFQIVR